MKIKKSLNVRFLAVLMVVAAVLGASVHFVHGFQVKRNARSLLWQADRAEEAKDADTTLDYLHSYLLLEPADTDARARYGELLDEQGKKTNSPRQRIEAFFELDSVLRRDPSRDGIRRRQVDLAMSMGRFNDARDHLRVLLGAKPDDAEMARLEGLMARCEEASGQFAEAVDWYQKAVRHAPERIENYQRSAVLYRDRLRKPAKADETMKAMIQANPQSPQALVTRFRFYLAPGGNPARIAEAAADVRAAQELAPQDPEVVLAAVDLARSRGELGKARDLLRESIQTHRREVRLYRALIGVELQDEKPKQALEVARQGLKEVRDDLDLSHSLAELLVGQGDLKEAEPIIERLRKAKYPAPLLDYLQARIHVHKGEWSEAIRLLEAIPIQRIRAASLALQTHLLLGQCYQRIGNPDRALHAYQEAEKLAPLSPTAAFQAGTILLGLERYDAALDKFRRLLKAPRVPPGTHALLARVLIVQNQRLPKKDRDLTELKDELALAAREAPNSIEVTALQADVLLLEDPTRIQEARRLMEKARDAHPDRLEPWVALAQLAGREKKPQEALRILDQARQNAAFAERIELRLARLGFVAALPPAEARPALAALEKEARELPAAERTRLAGALADAYARLGDGAEAQRLRSQIADQQPNNLSSHLALFDDALRAGDGKAMTQQIEAIKRVEGDGGAFWRFAAASRLVQQARPKDKEELSEDGRRDLRQARTYLVEAADRRPSWARIPLLEGELDEMEGNPGAAIEHYQKALTLGERRPALVRRLVELLVQQNRPAEAQRVIRKLLDQEGTLLSAGLGKLATAALLDTDPEERDPEHILALALKSVPPDSKRYQDHLWLGRIFAVLGKNADAQKAFIHARDLAEKEPETWVTLVSFLASTNRKKDAEGVIEQARKTLPPDKAPLALAACYELVGQLGQTEKQLQTALAAKRNDPQVLRATAGFYLRFNQPAKAEPLLRVLFGADSKASPAEAAWARRSLVQILSLSGNRQRFQEGLKLIEKNLAESKEPAAADREVKALLLSNRPTHRKEALRLYEDIARRGLTAGARYRLAQLYVADNNWAQAKLQMATLLNSPEGGGNPVYRLYYALQALQHDEIAIAEAQLEKLEKGWPNAPLVTDLKARVLKANGKDAEALALLRAFAQRKDVDRVEVARWLEALSVQGDPGGNYRKQAEEMYRQHADLSSQPDRFLSLAGFLGRQHAVTEALDCCDRALQAKAAPDAVFRAMVRVVRDGEGDKDQYRRVEERLNQALAKEPPDAVPLMLYLADLYSIQERHAEAEKLYDRVLRKDPKNPAALNNLAWLLAFKNDMTRTVALEMINQAIDLIGPLAEFLDTRAVVYLGMGQSKESIEDSQLALMQGPSAVRYFHLAQALELAKKHTPAANALREAQKRGLQAKQLHPNERPLHRKMLAALDVR